MLAILVVAASLVPVKPPASSGGFVGSMTCATCHEDVTQRFNAGPHGRAMAAVRGDALARACEGCHGPGEAHAANPTGNNIQRLAPNAPEVARACGSCHQGRDQDLQRRTPGHGRAVVSCLACHQSGHQPAMAEHLLAAPEDALCGGCHPTERSEFLLPFAHRETRTEPMACTACHGVHQSQANAMGLSAEPGKRCASCHAEKAGPFTYPHSPVEASGCIRCHRPHGSPNPQLLVRRDPGSLCLECHVATPPFHDLTKASFRQCQACHSAVHGSQRSPKLFEE